MAAINPNPIATPPAPNMAGPPTNAPKIIAMAVASFPLRGKTPSFTPQRAAMIIDRQKNAAPNAAPVTAPILAPLQIAPRIERLVGVGSPWPALLYVDSGDLYGLSLSRIIGDWELTANGRGGFA